MSSWLRSNAGVLAVIVLAVGGVVALRAQDANTTQTQYENQVANCERLQLVARVPEHRYWGAVKVANVADPAIAVAARRGYRATVPFRCTEAVLVPGGADAITEEAAVQAARDSLRRAGSGATP